MADTKIVITANTTQAEDALRSLGSKMEGLSRKFLGFSGPAAALTGALSVTAFAGFIKGAIDAADRMNDLAAKTGISTETLSTYQLLAEQNGTTVEGMANAMKHLSVTMSEHPEYLAKIGVATKDSAGHTRALSDVMKDVAEKFSGYKDGAEKVALAQSLLGKSGMDMIPVLNQGADGFSTAEEQAKKYGIALSSDFAAAADSFNDKVSLIELKSLGLARVMGGPLLKSLNDVADALLMPAQDDSFNNFLIGTALGITEFVRASVLGIKTLTFAFQELGIMVNTAGLQLAAMARISTMGDVGKIGREGMQHMTEVRDQYLKDSQSLISGSFVFGNPEIPIADQNSNKPRAGKAAPKVTPDAGAKQSDFESFQKRLLVDLAPQDADGKQTRAAKLQIELDLDRTITTKERERLQLLINQVDVMDAATAAKKSEREGQQVLIGLEKDFQNELEKRRDALNAPLLSASEKALADDMRTVTKRAQDSRIELEKLHVAGSLSAADYDKRMQQVTADEIAQKEAVRGLTAEQTKLNASWQYGADIALRQYLDEVQNVAKSSQAMFTNAFHGMEDALVQFVRTGKLDFKSLADNIINNLIRIQIQQSIMKPMAAAMDSAGGIGKLLGNFLGGSPTGMAGFSAAQLAGPVMSANGNVFSGAGISAYSGSVVDKPTLFPFARGTGLMGEAGPEAILPLTRINGKLGIQAQGGGNAAPNVVVNVVNQSGKNVNARQQGGPQFDGRDWVIGVVLEAADNNPHFRNAMGMA